MELVLSEYPHAGLMNFLYVWTVLHSGLAGSDVVGF